MLRKIKLLGIKIDPTLNNVRNLAADLTQLQAGVFRQTRKEHYLDYDSGAGHTNFELNKFGVALQQAIKADLRAEPSKSCLEFYIQLMVVLHEMRNYELAARVQAGINDALLRDHVEVVPGQYDLPPENLQVHRKRVILRELLRGSNFYIAFEKMTFPKSPDDRILFCGHKERNEKFVPIIQTLFFVTSNKIEKALLGKGDREDQGLEETKDEKIIRLSLEMAEISKDVIWIEDLLLNHLPPETEKGKLHFKDLRKRFKESLLLNLDDNPESMHTRLNKLLKMNDAKADLNPALGKVPELSLISSLVISRKDRVKRRTPRKKITDGDSFESPRSDSAVSPRSPRSDNAVSPPISPRKDGAHSPRFAGIAGIFSGAKSPRSPRSDESRTEDLYTTEESVSPRSEKAVSQPGSLRGDELVSPRVSSLRRGQ